MLLLTVRGKETPCTVVAMTADAHLRKRDMEGFGDNPYLPDHPTPKVTA